MVENATSDWQSGHLLYVRTKYQNAKISRDTLTIRTAVAGEWGGKKGLFYFFNKYVPV